MSDFAERRRQWLTKDQSVHWLHTRRLCYFGPCVCGVQLQSRQRPRKKVRLGKRGRRLALAASMGEALELVRQKRLDRGEIGG
jgi:hypothetical protein